MTNDHLSLLRAEFASAELDIAAIGRRVLEIEADAVRASAGTIDEDFIGAVWSIARTRGRVVVTGVGKSGIVGRKLAATLASIGRPAFFVHANEASHGDIGMLARGDLLLALSNSGETPELSDIVGYCETHDIDIVALVGDRDSALGRAAKFVVTYPKLTEACPTGLVPTTSTTVMMALGDALAVGVMEVIGVTPDDFHRFHPGGRLGARLMKVNQIMRKGDELPIVSGSQPMQEVVIEITSKSLGVALVVNQFGDLAGVITDGDMRRNIHRLWTSKAADIAHSHPHTVGSGVRVVDALAQMTEAKVSSLPVLDDEGRLVGLVHMLDCLRMGFVAG